MQNVDVKKEKDKLIVTIDLKAKTTASKSGKSLMIATTNGNQRVIDDIVLGLSCYRKNPEYVKGDKEE